MLDHINNLNPKKLLEKAYDQVSPEIEEMIRDRLYKEGTRADESKIITFANAPGEVYATSTIKRKRKKGQPSDRVTLKDSGDFYGTIDAEAKDNFVEITGDTDKFSSTVAPEGVLDLTSDQWTSINAKVVDIITDEIRDSI